MNDINSLLTVINHSLHIIMLTILPVFMLSVEIYYAIKAKRKVEKLRRCHDIFAVTYAIIRLELYVADSLQLEKLFTDIAMESIGLFLIFLLVFGVSELYVHHGLPIRFWGR